MNRPMIIFLILLSSGCSTPQDPNVKRIIEACESYVARMDQESRDRIQLCEGNPESEECEMYTYEKVLFGTAVRNDIGLWKQNDLVDAFHQLGITHPEIMSGPIMEGITAKKTCDAGVISHEIEEIRKALGVIEN